MVLGGEVTDATALNNFECLKIEFDGLHPFAIDSGREDKELGLRWYSLAKRQWCMAVPSSSILAHFLILALG